MVGGVLVVAVIVAVVIGVIVSFESLIPSSYPVFSLCSGLQKKEQRMYRGQFAMQFSKRGDLGYPSPLLLSQPLQNGQR